MVILSRRSARLLVLPLVALLAAACEHNDLGTGTSGGGGGPGPSLGTAATYGILAATPAVSCVTGGTIEADVGISPAAAITGFPPCTLTGTRHAGDAAAATAQVDLTTAYNALVALTCPTLNNFGTVDQGGTTKTPGVYCSGSTIGVTGTITLDGQGDPNARFVFQAGSALGAFPGSVALINGTQAKNVWWQVTSSATLNAGSFWRGNIVALSSITLNDDVHMIGRALARNGAITLGTNDFIILP
jgi:hypothetical protein